MRRFKVAAAFAHSYASLAVLAVVMTSKDSELWNAALPLACGWSLITLQSLRRLYMLLCRGLPPVLVSGASLPE